MISSKAKPSKLLGFVVQVLFYSALCFFIAIFLGEELSFTTLRSSFFPLTSKTYWFATVYALLYLAIPLLNRLILGMTKSQHLLWLGILLVVYSVIPTFAWWSRDYLSKGNNLIWFVILYMTAAYIRLYGIKLSNVKWLLGYLGATVGLLLSNLLIASATCRFFGQVKSASLFYLNNTIFVYVSAVCLFCLFKELKMSNKMLTKLIVSVAPFSFGVYLLHENPLLRERLWAFVNASRFMGGRWDVFLTLLYMCGIILAFFIVAVALTMVYKLFYYILKPIEKRIDVGMNKIIVKINGDTF